MKKFRKILLIDDDPISNFINTAVVRVTKLGEAKVVVNGAEAMDYLMNECDKENDYPDLIFVDINMPVMDGFEFLNQYANLKINQSDKAIIMMLSTSSDPQDVRKIDKLGIRLLKKPLTVNMIEALFGEEVAHVPKI
jgi:CheY-like chemotaxis protein